MIHIKDLHKSYGKKPVLKGINYTFDEGKVYGVVGKNGAGKTTFFKCIAGLLTYEGEINIDQSHAKQKIGFLYTNPITMSYVTGWEYLKLHCTARGITREDYQEQNIFELPLDQYIEHYSTGMLKKLAFLAILLQRNDIYILDEPFNGVDIQSNIILSAVIQKFKATQKTLLISSHIYSSLQENCDEICILNQGMLEDPVHKDDFGRLGEQLKNDIVDTKLDNLQL
jgi:ABC-2 type transport system ATP-binding protein